MPDFQQFVRTHVSVLALPAAREDKIVEEWAAHLSEVYEALLAEGLTDAEAWSRLQQQLPDWGSLHGMLLADEPIVTRALPLDAGARWSSRRVLAALRQSLTAGLAGDLRSALRLLLADRGFSATVILTLAICLGANAAIFTVVYSVLLRPLPIPEGDRIVALGDVYPTVTPNDILSNDVPSYFDRLEALTTLEDQALFTFWFDTIAFDSGAEEVRGMRATPSLFRLLRTAPTLGRTFTDAEGEPGAEPTVILSHGLWQRLYGGDPSVVGQRLRLGWTGQPYTIVGVMPGGFSFFDRGYDGHSRAPGDHVQFWIPLSFTPAQRSDAARTRYGFYHVGRLRSAATLEQVQAQADALLARTVERYPQFSFSELGVYTAVTPLHGALTRDVRPTLYLLWGAAIFVLLIGAINVASLSLARASARARALAVRLALGASRIQVTRQLLIEGLVPALIGGAAGIALAAFALRVLAANGLGQLPGAERIAIDPVVIAFIAAISMLVGVLIGLVPATTASRTTFNESLLEGGRSGTDGRRMRMVRRGLVVAQIALSVVLLMGAGLLLTSFRHLLGVDAGFTAANVFTGTIFPPPSRYADAQAVTRLTERILEQVRTLPGVRQAGMTSNIALSGFASPSTVSDADIARNDADPPIVPSVVVVTPGYFETMGISVVRGRPFASSDGAESQRVAIVDQRLAARLWPGQDPLGRRINRGESEPYTVVGLVRDVRFEGLADSQDAVGAAYFPQAQAPPSGRLRWLAVNSTLPPDAIAHDIRKVLSDIDPYLPLSDAQTMTERTSQAVTSQRLAASLATLFGIVALLLSMLGVYGVLAYVVARRSREIGIRMALGSSVRGIFRLVFSEGASLVTIGLVLGIAGALLLGRTLEGQLFGVRPSDPLILAATVLLTGAIALTACIFPALRAAKVNPIHVLSDH